MTHPILTEDEGAVVQLLGEAWNAYLRLQPVHPSDVGDFLNAVHQAQRIVLARPALQIADPDVVAAIVDMRTVR